ncbi:MAG: hydroxysteroid dehydrogenase-like protein 2, partial [Chloroflexota bacterium]|nr:hydroxysteroid dehydrogenase-like protein 2 [Chloroflexota bacterium]
NTLKLEGEKYDIKVNTVAPLAGTRLTEDVFPSDIFEKLKPQFVAPLVLYLCSELCPVTGRIYNAGAGYYGRAAVVSGPGVWVSGEGEIPTPEGLAAQWEKITSITEAREYPNANTALMDMLTKAQEPETISDTREEISDVRVVFERMGEFFQADAAAGVAVVFQFNISGPSGGDWHVTVKNNTCAMEAGIHDKPTTTLKMESEDFLALVTGRLPSMQAFTSGKLKIEGDLMKSQLVEKLFKF